MGDIVLQPPAKLTAAAVIVRLRDTTLADATSVTVAESRFDVSGTAVVRVPFQLDLSDDLPTGRSYTLGAEVRRQRKDDVEQGDYLNMQSVMWSPSDTSKVEIPVRQIGSRTRRKGSSR